MEGLLKRCVVAVAIGFVTFVTAQQLIAVQGVAQALAQAPVNATASGELAKVDQTERTFLVKTSAEDMEFRYTDQTKIIGSHRGTAGLASLTGAQVIVEYKTEGQFDIAMSIDVRTPQPPPAVPTP